MWIPTWLRARSSTQNIRTSRCGLFRSSLVPLVTFSVFLMNRPVCLLPALVASGSAPAHYFGRNVAVGWETYTANKARVLLPRIALLGAIIAGASLLVLRRRRLI